MNWFEWSFGDGGWTVPFWFLPLVFFWVWKNNSQRKTEELASKIRDEDSEDYMSGVNSTVGNSDSTVGETSFENKCVILGELWLQERNSEEFADFIEYNDLGLPLAYAIDGGMVVPNESAKSFVEEAWSLLLAGYDVEDSGFESWDELLDAVDGQVFGEGEESYDEDDEVVLDENDEVVEVKPSNSKSKKVNKDAAAKAEFEAPPSGKKF